MAQRQGTSPNSYLGAFRGLDSDRAPESGMGPMWLTDGKNFVIRNGRIEPRPGRAKISPSVAPFGGRLTTAYTVTFSDADDVVIIAGQDAAHLNLYLYDSRGHFITTIGQFPNDLPLPVRPTFAYLGIRTIDVSGTGTITRTGPVVLIGSGLRDWTNSSAHMGIPGGAFCIQITSTRQVYVFPCGLPAPDSTPTLTNPAAGSGGLYGAFTYKTAWFRASDNAESAPSAESVPLAVGNALIGDPILITRNAAYPTYGYPSHWRVYRKRVGATTTTEKDNTGASVTVGDGVGADDNWYLVKQVALGVATYSDKTSDGQLGTAVVRPQNLFPPPYTQYTCLHRGRMFYAPVNSDLVYFSELPDDVRGPQYEYVGVVSFFHMPFFEKGEVITGLWSFGHSLIVWSNLHAYRVSGTDALESSDPVIDRLNGAAGCDCQWAAQELPETSRTPGLLIYPNRNGVYLFDGQGTRCISKNEEDGGIVSIFSGLLKVSYYQNFNSWYWSSATIDPVSLEYLLTCPTPTGGSIVLCYSTERPAWSKWDIAPTVFFRVNLGLGWSTCEFALSDGHIYRLGDAEFPEYTDNGASFAFEAQFVRQFIPAVDKTKFREFWVQWDRVPGASTLYVGTDDTAATSVAPTVTKTAAALAKRFASRYPLDVTGERVTLRVAKTISHTNGSDFAAVCGFGIDTESLGVRP